MNREREGERQRDRKNERGREIEAKKSIVKIKKRKKREGLFV